MKNFLRLNVRAIITAALFLNIGISNAQEVETPSDREIENWMTPWAEQANVELEYIADSLSLIHI